VGVRVHVNCAITLDGCLGGGGRTQLRISNAEDLRRVHRLRARSDAILVGVGTVLADDPKLTVKWAMAGLRPGLPPLRVVLDPRLRTPPNALVLNGAAPTIVFVGAKARGRAGVRLERIPLRRRHFDLARLLDRLSDYGVRRLMVEGGQRTLTRFFAEDRVDEATIFVSPRVLGDPTAPRLSQGSLDLRRHLRLRRAQRVGDGALLMWTR
jgi:2,5-diamino-6-(ribosylamino)-4(3H)-pyrimidinone 5'-phosphate reductase